MALVVVRTADQVTWADILRALPPGRPVSVLSDEDNSLFNAVDEVQPLDRSTGEASPQIHFCIWHLMKHFRELTSPWGPLLFPRSPPGKTLESPMRTEAEWRTFLAQALQLNDDLVDKQLRRLNRDGVVTHQLVNSPLSVTLKQGR